MNQQDRQAIESVFNRLAKIEKNGSSRDSEAEALIQSRLSDHPGSAYYLAQTVLGQEQVLQAARKKIQLLEQRSVPSLDASGNAVAVDTTAAAGTGVNTRAVGSSRQKGRLVRKLGFGSRGNKANQQRLQTGESGGFITGVMQTALGIAGEVMLGNMLGGPLANDAEAATQEPEAQNADADSDNEEHSAENLGAWADGGDFDDGGGLDEI